MSEVTGSNSKLTEEEIENFSHDTENEMFKFFNKDTGTKYKAKYRSLMFNIKDRKNTTLFQKICDKKIKPKQLVKMTPDEMASQELALWRENENKHQLEMIKKSELDLLACSKSYVLKTHKGEEVFESRTSDRVLLDPATAIEDVVSVLNNSGPGVDEDEALLTQNPINRFDKNDRTDFLGSSFTSTPIMVNSSTNSSKSSLKKKESRHSRSRSRERHETSRSSRSSKHKRKRSRERRSKSRDTKRLSRSNDREKSKKDDKKDRKKDDEKKKISVKEVLKKPQIIKNEEFNLIDQIIEASSSTTDKLKSEEPEIKKEIKIVQPEIVKKSNSFESDQEPTSTVTIPTPPDNLDDSDTNEPEPLFVLWNGTISHADVVSFNIKMHPVSRDSSNISKHLADTLKIVGRIRPETVWDYIEKIKIAPNKQVLIVRFSSELDQTNYDILYNGFYSKNRVGVIESKSPSIKDFYLVPLPAEKQIPHFLLPLTKPGFVEGANKPNLLIGIIVKINGQRSLPLPPVISAKVIIFSFLSNILYFYVTWDFCLKF